MLGFASCLTENYSLYMKLGQHEVGVYLVRVASQKRVLRKDYQDRLSQILLRPQPLL